MSEAVNPVDTGAAGGDQTSAQDDNQQQTIADGGGEGTTTHTAEFPNDWREKWAGEDQKLLSRLKRFTSPQGVMNAWLNADKKINSGKLVQPLSENPSEDELKAWRVANDVPEAPDKYDTNIGEGMVFGEEDKPILDSFLADAHAANMPQQYAKTALKWYYNYQDKIEQELFEANDAARVEGLSELKSEYGNEFQANLNAVKGMFSAAGQDDLYLELINATDSSGIKLGNRPALMRLLVNAAVAMNPAATVLPGAAGASAMGIEEEIKAIEKKMGTPEYQKDEKMQARYRDLIDARLRLQGRTAA